MKNFRIVPLSKEYAANIRRTGKDAFEHDVVEQVATGRGPCRVSLRSFVPGKDKRLLFTHTPFEKDNVYNQPGPVFISAEETEPYTDIYHFPEEIKNDKEHYQITLIGYDVNQMMVYTRLVKEEDIDELIERIFNKHHEVHYLHARNATAGCFICKVERI